MRRWSESVRVFDNPLLESLTHVHPATPLLLWGPVVLWLIWRSFAIHHLSVAAVLVFLGRLPLGFPQRAGTGAVFYVVMNKDKRTSGTACPRTSRRLSPT